MRQNIKRRQHAMGKELSLFGNEIDMNEYRLVMTTSMQLYEKEKYLTGVR